MKLSHWKGVIRFGWKWKLSLRYIGPYEILECVVLVAYKLRLPTELLRIYDVFHVSMLRKYVLDSSHILPNQPLKVQEKLTYEEKSLLVLDIKEQIMRTRMIPMVKILWSNYGVEEANWENEEQMEVKYPQLFASTY